MNLPEVHMPIFLDRLFGRATVLPREATRPGAAGPSIAEELPPGCGWFDSSHELQRGLSVSEHLSPDAVANDLPLESWLALHLAANPSRAPA